MTDITQPFVRVCAWINLGWVALFAAYETALRSTSLCTNNAYLQKMSVGKSVRLFPEIENLENCLVYQFLRSVSPVIKGSGERRDGGKLHFPVKIFRIITADSMRDTRATGIMWKSEECRRSLSSLFVDSIYFRCTRLLLNETFK